MNSILKNVAVLAAGLYAASTTFAGTITVKGSDTLVTLAQKWAEVYMGKNPATKIQVTGGGSGTGFAALQNRSTDLCNASRKIKSTEIEACIKAFGKRPREYAVADRIPMLQVSLLSGPGGIGKSLLILQLLASSVLGRDWIGSTPQTGSAIYLAAEDEQDEIQSRLAAIAENYGDVSADDMIDKGLCASSFAGEDMAATMRSSVRSQKKSRGPSGSAKVAAATP